MKTTARALALCLTAAALLAGSGAVAQAGEPALTGGVTLAREAAGSPSGAHCRNYRFPVRIGAANHQIFGQLCVRGRLTSRTPLQILLHGGTYDHSYWDWPQQPRRYSYVYHATRAGYATLNLDRLGYGRSSHPDPTTLDFAVGGQAVHQVVQHLRRGALGQRFSSIVLNGHSMGGLVAERAAPLGGVDAVIVSGIPAKRPNVTNDRGAPREDLYPFYPAEKDPKFAGRPWAPGYLTTLPGTRVERLHYPGTYDPVIVPFEEALKDTLSIAELRAVRPPGGDDSPETARRPITVPVAYALGRHDVIACKSKDCTTDPAGQGAAHITANSGHSINLSRGVAEFYRWTFDWLAGQGIRP